MVTEQQILSLIRQLTPNSKKYLHDDAAVIEKNLVITTDTLVENTHFTLKNYKPEEVGWKALAVNLSDIAAMGGKPLYALVSLSLSKSLSEKWIKGFYKGLLACAKKYKTQIIGGNLARSKEVNITITVIGKAVVKTPRRGVSTRSNAKAGDLVFTCGNFGESALGLNILKRKINNFNTLIKIHKMPVPQISQGQHIAKKTKRASIMDGSDGLADCIIQIAEESNVKIIIEEDKIPVSYESKKAAEKLHISLLNLALYGGEDYKLVGTASKYDCKKLKNIKIIGKVVKGKGAFLKQKNGMVVKLDVKKAYEHFK